MKYLALFIILIMTSCSSIESLYPDIPKAVATAQVSLAAAEHTALIYASLPLCGKTKAILCRTSLITQKITVADKAAFDALSVARLAETQDKLDAAMTAISALTSITNTLQIGD